MSIESQELLLERARTKAWDYSRRLSRHYRAMAWVLENPRVVGENAASYSVDLQIASTLHQKAIIHLSNGMGEDALETLKSINWQRTEDRARACGVHRRWTED